MSEFIAETGWPRVRVDHDYNARASVSLEIFEGEMRRYRELSDEALRMPGARQGVVYDEESGQTIDVLGAAAGELRPVFLFIHGGYWRALSKNDSAFMAPMLARAGVATAVMDYRLAPEVTLAEIVREVRAAVAFIWRNGPAYGLDPQRIFVGGSSAGGHLTGALLAGGWHDAFDVPVDIVKGAMPISGLFHLGPIAKSFVQEWIQLDEASVAALSPLLNMPDNGCPILVAYADGEPAGFKRQSVAFDKAWRGAGFESALMEVPNRNHFDLLIDMTREDSALSRGLLQLIYR